MKAEGGAVAAARTRRRNTASISFDCIQIFSNVDGSIWRAAIERSLSLGRSVQHGNPRWRERGTEAGGTSEEQMAWKAKKKKTKKKTTGKLEKTSGKPGINPGRKIREYLDTHKHTHTRTCNTDTQKKQKYWKDGEMWFDSDQTRTDSSRRFTGKRHFTANTRTRVSHFGLRTPEIHAEPGNVCVLCYTQTCH